MRLISATRETRDGPVAVRVPSRLVRVSFAVISVLTAVAITAEVVLLLWLVTSP